MKVRVAFNNFQQGFNWFFRPLSFSPHALLASRFPWRLCCKEFDPLDRYGKPPFKWVPSLICQEEVFDLEARRIIGPGSCCPSSNNRDGHGGRRQSPRKPGSQAGWLCVCVCACVCKAPFERPFVHCKEFFLMPCHFSGSFTLTPSQESFALFFSQYQDVRTEPCYRTWQGSRLSVSWVVSAPPPNLRSNKLPRNLTPLCLRTIIVQFHQLQVHSNVQDFQMVPSL